MITVYGLKNCDTCKKALREIAAAGLEHLFVDIRDEADLATLVPLWLEQVEAKVLLNSRSTTWRNLSDADKARAETDASALLMAHPTLIKRPVIELDGAVFVSWSPAVKAAILGVNS